MNDVKARTGELEKLLNQLTTLIDNMPESKDDMEPESDIPKLAAPARRALGAAGYLRLEQLTSVTESELAQLHSMGLLFSIMSTKAYLIRTLK